MNKDTLLLRQIHPNHVQNKTVSVQAFVKQKEIISSLSFIPSPKDEDKLSVYNGEKYTAEESYEHYTKNFSSQGVLSVSVEEVTSLPPLNAYEDNIPFDGHSYIDFSQVESKSQKEKRAGKLRDLAVKRGWLFKLDK